MENPARSARDIAEILGADPSSVPDGIEVRRVRPPGEDGPGDVVVLTGSVDRERASALGASLLVVREDADVGDRAAVRVRDPRMALATLLGFLHEPPRVVSGVAPSAVVDASARLGRDVNVGAHVTVGAGAVIGDRVDLLPGVVVGERAEIGADSVLDPHVVVYPGTRIGERCRIHAGAVLGSEGFGYQPNEKGEWIRIPQVGVVVLEDDVEIGANTTIDRATMTETRIGRGSKIDNLCQIAHNVEMGRHVVVSGLSGIAGSVRLDDHAIVAAGAGIRDHLRIGKAARVGARAGVHRDVPDGESVAGYPAIPLEEFLQSSAVIRRLPQLRRRVQALEATLRDPTKR